MSFFLVSKSPFFTSMRFSLKRQEIGHDFQCKHFTNNGLIKFCMKFQDTTLYYFKYPEQCMEKRWTSTFFFKLQKDMHIELRLTAYKQA